MDSKGRKDAADPEVPAEPKTESTDVVDTSLPEIIVVVDLHDGKMFSSPRFDLGGQVSDVAPSNETGGLLRMEDERRFLATALEKLTFGDTAHSRHTVGLRDGTWRNVESRGTIIRDPDGTPSKIMALIRDVTHCR